VPVASQDAMALLSSLRRAGGAARWPPQLQLSAAFAKEASAAGGGRKAEGDTRLNTILAALAPKAAPPPPPPPPEEAAADAARAREHSRRMMAAHRELQADLSTKLRLKQAAVAALPPDLRAAAEVPDLAPFPANRRIWTESPPPEEDAAGPARIEQGARRIGTKRR
jgi:hypothetical protein